MKKNDKFKPMLIVSIQDGIVLDKREEYLGFVHDEKQYIRATDKENNRTTLVHKELVR